MIIDKKPTNFASVTIPGIFLGLAWRYGKKGSCVITDDYKRLYITTDVTFRPACFPAKIKRNNKKKSEDDSETLTDDNDLLKHFTTVKDIEILVQNDPETNLPQLDSDRIRAMRDQAIKRPLCNPHTFFTTSTTISTSVTTPLQVTIVTAVGCSIG